MNKKMSKKTKRTLIAVVVVIVVLLAMSVYTVFIKPGLEQVNYIYNENQAQYGVLQSGVTESGTVTMGLTTQEYDLDVSTDDDDDDDDDDTKYLQVEEVYAVVGQVIKEGDPIYKFSDASVESVRKALTYEQTEARIALAQAQAEMEVGVITAGLSKDETELAYALAQQNYDVSIAKINQEANERVLKIEQLLSEIVDLQYSLVEDDYREQMHDLLEAYEDAQDDYDEIMGDDSYAFTKQLEVIETLKSAKESYEKFMDSHDSSNDDIDDKLEEIADLQKEIEQQNQLVEKTLLSASQTLESTNVSGSIAEQKYSNSLKSYETAVSKTQNTLDEATEKLEAFEAFIGDGTVYAEGAGIITEMGYEEDDYLISAGTLISYAAEENKTVSVDVSEEDVVSVSVGDSVKITFSAYPDEEYEGVVSSITTTATSRSTATVSYPVEISIQGDTSKLYGGMTADVTFVTEKTEEVVYIPRKAIVEQNNKKYVYKKSGNDYVLSEITTGFTDGENVEVISGLEKDESYYIQSVEVEQEEMKGDTGNEANS